MAWERRGTAFLKRLTACGYLLLPEMLKCKKIFYNHNDKSFVLDYNNSEKTEGGYHGEI